MKAGGIALALSAVALGVAVVTLTREPPPTARTSARSDRLTQLELEVADLKQELALWRRDHPESARRTGSLPRIPTGDAETGDVADAPADGKAELEAIVDDAVDRKTRKVLDKLRVKENKKPAMSVFAGVLELSDEQRTVTERLLVEGQRELHAILRTPTHDGTNLMDELVEIAARGIAEPGKDHGFGRWIGRLLIEKIPGTDETYGARLERLKRELRGNLKREWTETQYREFESWALDPTEIRQIPGSPIEPLEKRILERARALGADIPAGG